VHISNHQVEQSLGSLFTSFLLFLDTHLVPHNNKKEVLAKTVPSMEYMGIFSEVGSLMLLVL
jgi:hypothetical protein